MSWFRREPHETPALAGRGRKPLAVRMLGGTRTDRLTADWVTAPEKVDALIRKHQRILAARSRQQASTNDYARSFVRMVRQNVVGPKGVQLQAQSRGANGKLDSRANQAIEEAFLEWGHRKNCDVTGEQSWSAIQREAITTAVVDGEFFLRKIVGPDAGPWGFALQALDPQRCHVQFDENGLSDGRFIRGGIEYNRYGRPLAYFFEAGEGDSYHYSYSGRNYLRIPADEIIHGYRRDIAGQRRGLPWMMTSLFRMHQLAGFEEAALINARVGAGKMGVLQWLPGHAPEYDDEERKYFEMSAEPGEFPILPDGIELKEWAPQFPSGEFAVFSKAMLRGIASGFGVLYNNLASDLEHVNFSSIRQGTLDEREHWKELQEWLIESLVQPVFEAWLPIALLSGRITVEGRPLKPERLSRYASVSWQPRRWAWIDPRSDIEAAVSAKNNLLMAPGQIIREQGRDPSDVWREIASDIAEMQAAGIPAEYIKSAILDTNLQATVQAELAQAKGGTDESDH